MRSEHHCAVRVLKHLRRPRIAAAFVVVAGLLVACGGGGGPPDQSKPVINRLTGLATSDGKTLQTINITAKGASGPARRNASVSNDTSTTYAVATDQLTAPYMVATADGQVSVATAQGRANVTQLTSLLAIALFGQEDAFNDYGDASAAQIALITDANIQRAQADATDFLENTVHVHVRSGTASFITTEFQAVAGDTMWDTLVDLNARIAELGPDAYNALRTTYIHRQRQCRLAQVQFAVGGATTRFCPDTTTSTTDASDAGVLDHVFSQTTGETLTLRVRGDALIDAVYVTADGAQSSCSGSACTGIVLGKAAFDTTRSVTLTSAALSGTTSAGNTTATGRLTTTIPNVTLPDPPCFVGYVQVIGSDGSVDSGCGDNSEILFLLGVTGTGGGQEGASTSVNYTAGNNNNVVIALNGSTLVSITAMVPSPDGSSTVTAECRGTDCQGVTIGPTTVNMNFGIETDTRTITLDGTALHTVAADGSLGTDAPVRLKASLRLTYFSTVDFTYATPHDPHACDGQPNHVRLAPDDTPAWVYDLCSDASTPGSVAPLDSGGIEITYYYGGLTIDTDADGQVVRVRLVSSPDNTVSESFGCDGVAGCHGVTVGVPDANGNQHVSIVGAIFHDTAFDGFASGPRTGPVTGEFDAVPSGQ